MTAKQAATLAEQLCGDFYQTVKAATQGDLQDAIKGKMYAAVVQAAISPIDNAAENEKGRSLTSAAEVARGRPPLL